METKKWEGAIEVPVDLLEPNPWNPQKMTDVQFNALVEEIRKNGFDEPILATPHPEKPGMYRILGGEHRWKAVRLLGFEKVPVVVKENLDELEQKTMTVRRNLLRGDLDRVRFTSLVNDVMEKHEIPLQDLIVRMGFEKELDFEKVYLREKEEEEERFTEAAKEIKSKVQVVDNLSYLLNDIFRKFGGTLEQGFIFFFYKKKMHLMIQMNKDLEEQVELMVGMLKAGGGNVNEFLAKAIGKELAQAPSQACGEKESSAVDYGS